MGLKEEMGLAGGKALGGSLPPILKMTEHKGCEFLGTFTGYKHIEKEVGVGKKKQQREFDVFTFDAIKATGIDATAGNSYSLFASGQMRHLLSEVIASPLGFVGKKFLIVYVGTEKMSSGAYRGKDVHKFTVEIFD